MNGMFVFLMSVIVSLLSILWLYVASRDAVGCYRGDIKEGKKTEPYYSFSFSAGSAYGLLFFGVAGPILYLFESAGIISVNMFEKINLPSIILMAIFLTTFVFLITACEWLLRKMARRNEPGIQFDRWLWLM